ncbi:hypothetical protein [Mechercharimyces sp. CAU 1602]|uniref:hypothetical protein n=1 Tax=Mechercharimyces sp. CAU 1602 TaxID=2973933 RepID=UPI002161527E|nr:hypothetical protein [Mechercharimyces sp. CAU 1602]MCS1350921.1 hypothetical protein [Mechercharimyces sp. CAU 1602]
MRERSTKRRMVSFVILCAVCVLSILFFKGAQYLAMAEDDYRFARKVEGVVIQGSDVDYSALVGEEMMIQANLLDFSNELNLETYSFEAPTLEGFEVTDMNVELFDRQSLYQHYIVSMTLIPQVEGEYTVRGLKTNITMGEKRVEVGLGDFFVHVGSSRNKPPLDIQGSSFSHSPEGKLHLSYDMKNVSDEEITIVGIENNNPLYVRKRGGEKGEVIKKGESQRFLLDYDVPGTYNYVIFQPRMIYTINGVESSSPLPAGFAYSNLSPEQLQQLLAEQGLLNE